MTTQAELSELISNGENSGVEFKRDVMENSALAWELVAFSNLPGGVVLLGVEDDGSISGLTRSALAEWVMTACRDKIQPAVIPFFEIIRDVEPDKDVAVVRVAPGFSVHSVWHNSRNTYYIRVGTQSREATPEELSRLSSSAARSGQSCAPSRVRGFPRAVQRSRLASSGRGESEMQHMSDSDPTSRIPNELNVRIYARQPIRRRLP